MKPQPSFHLFFAVFTLLLLGGTVVLAQKPGTKAAPSAANHKKTLAQTFLGKVSGNITISAEEARQLITLPLKITDDKNVPYLISSYQLVYQRTGVTEDEATGKTSAQKDIVANRFTVTPLPAVWQKNIIEGLHSGEQLYFFDIIVFDKQGRRFFAPELKITVQ